MTAPAVDIGATTFAAAAISSRGEMPVRVDDVTVAHASEHATDGMRSLRVDATGGGWFGAALADLLDLAAKGTPKLNLATLEADTSASVAFPTGPGYAWCKSTWGYQGQGASATLEVDLTSGLSCTTEDLKDVRGLFTWSIPGSFSLDHIRAG